MCRRNPDNGYSRYHRTRYDDCTDLFAIGHDYEFYLFAIGGEDFSVRRKENSSKSHQVFFGQLDRTISDAHLREGDHVLYGISVVGQ